MLSEPFLDGIALAFLVVTGLAWAKVFRSWRRTPTNWIGPQAEFEKRLKREDRWSAIGWVSLVASVLVTIVDLIIN